MSYIGYFFDVLVLAALGATIYHALRLSRQFAAMQADRKAFDALIQSLNIAASRAEAAIKSLRDAATESGNALQEKVNRCRGLADELEIMIQAGDNLADRLNKVATESRKAASPTPSFIDDEDEKPKAAAAQPRSKAEKELLEALKAKQKS